MDGAGTDIALLLRRGRRRAFLALALRYAILLFGCGAVVLVAIAIVLGPQSASVPAEQFSVLMAVLAASSLLVAAGRTPSSAEVARQIDRGFGLQQRLETAVEFWDAKDEVAVLVKLDASRRAAHLDPAAVFPLRPTARPAWLLIAAAALSLAMLVRWGALGGGGGRVGGGVRGASTAEARRDVGAGAEPADESTGRAVRADAGGVTASDRRGRAAAAGGDEAFAPIPDSALPTSGGGSPGPDRDDVTPAGSPAGTSGSGSAAQSEDGAESLADSPRRQGPPAPDKSVASPRPRGETDPTADEPSSGSSSSEISGLGAREGGSDLSSSEGSPANASAQSAPGLARDAAAVGGPAATAGAGSGGTDSPPAGSTVPADPARPSAVPDAVEEAIAREHLPPGLRQYVRDYFLAIRPRV